MVWEGADVIKKIDNVALEAAWLAGQDLIAKSINDAPLDTGTLRRSGVVTTDSLPNSETVYSEAKSGSGKKSESAKAGEPPMGANARSPRVFVSYNTPYAIWLHESPHWKPRAFKRTAKGRTVQKPAVGRWKWLEAAVPRVSKRWNSYLARAKRKVMGI